MSKIFLLSLVPKPKHLTSSHLTLHGTDVASTAVGGTSSHPGRVLGVAQGPQAAASQLKGSGPVEGSVHVWGLASGRTPL